MALKLQFEIWAGEPLAGGTATDTIDLLSYTDDFNLKTSGYEPGVAQDENTPIIEKLTLNVKEASHDALSASLQDLSKYIQAAKFAQTASVPFYTVWLRTKLTNETGERVAYVYDIDVSQNDKYGLIALGKNVIKDYVITIKRAPLWERDVNARDMTDAAATYDLTSVALQANLTVYGDAPARMRSMILKPHGAAAIDIDELWWGWVSEGNYPMSNDGVHNIFKPYWKIEEASALGTDTSLQTVAGTVGTKAVQCSFATVTAMKSRVKISRTDVYSTYPAAGTGKFLVLLRAGLSGAGEVHVRIGAGICNPVYNATDPFAKRGRVSITKNTGFYIYELGVIQFPIEGFISSDDVNGGIDGIQIEAELISGSVSLNMDLLYFIPLSEGWGHISGLADAASDMWGVAIGDTYHVGPFAHNILNSSDISAYTPSVQLSGGIPIGSSGVALVLVGQRAASSVNGDTIDIDNLYVKDRYRELRGAG